jgi:hypothetical protein
LNTHIIDVSDTHGNSTLGLYPPELKLDDGGKREYNEVQKYIWEAWLDFWLKHVKPLRGPKIGIFKGDLCDTDPGQRVSNNRADILKILHAIYEPALDILDTIFVVRGTEYHTGVAAELEELFAHQIGAEKCPETDSSSWWHLRMAVDGVNLDFAHHTSIGGLPWTAPGPLVRLIFQTIAENSVSGLPVPHIISRGHVHKHIDTYKTHPQVRAYTTNAWQGKTAYAHKRATGKTTEYGGSIITINNGDYEIEHVTYYAKKDPVWQWKPASS